MPLKTSLHSVLRRQTDDAGEECGRRKTLEAIVWTQLHELCKLRTAERNNRQPLRHLLCGFAASNPGWRTRGMLELNTCQDAENAAQSLQIHFFASRELSRCIPPEFVTRALMLVL